MVQQKEQVVPEGAEESQATAPGAAEESRATAPPVHGLRWAIKTSFVAYVARMQDGRAHLGNGVAVNERNEMIFPLEEDAASVTETFAFGGDVRFVGHFGMLSVHIALPRVVVRAGGRGELTVLDPASRDGGRLRLVTFDLTGRRTEGGIEEWHATDVRLAPEGVELFGDVYEAGEPFAPLTITVPRPERPEHPGRPEGNHG
ncbi:HtaA domain-containing protein [Streptomyces sp. NPDC057621]|uniref:HtaA domain-containing protein n=1 Tax=Streptomyces sp. NPDC057621 TaxID=3346186 RepID=UPI0036773A3B